MVASGMETETKSTRAIFLEAVERRPDEWASFLESACNGDDQLHDRVMRISSAIYTVGGGPSSYLRGLKCALVCLGICADHFAEPFVPFTPAQREQIASRLRDLGLMQEVVAHGAGS